MTGGCDWSVFGGFLWLLLQFKLGDSQEQVLKDRCDENDLICIDRFNLECRSGFCECKAGTVELDTNRFGQCGPPLAIDESCVRLSTPRCGLDNTYFLECGTGGTCTCVDGYQEADSTRCVSMTSANFGKPCGPPPALPCTDGSNLKCEGGTCACANDDLTEFPDGTCGPPPDYRGKCGDPSPKCAPDKHLGCVDGTCRCVGGTLPIDGKCGLAAVFGQKCGRPDPPCRFQSNLLCVNRLCECFPADFDPIVGGGCGPRGRFNESCGPPRCELGPTWNLECDPKTSLCVCSDSELVPDRNLRCGPSALLGATCGPPVCSKSANLVCTDGTVRICVCAAGFVKVDETTCGAPARLGEPCGVRICAENSNLHCPNGECQCEGITIPNAAGTACAPPPPSILMGRCDVELGYFCKLNVNLVCNGGKCVCSMRWMLAGPQPGTAEPGGCVVRPKSTLTKFCQLNEDCMPNFNLVCNSIWERCECARFHGPDPVMTDRCREIPRKYGERCQKDLDCLQHHNMLCHSMGVCLCQPGTDLDHGVTPCKDTPFNGRTYGLPCEDFPPEHRCFVPHNIECVQNTCVCILDHVVNEDTKKDAAIGVTTCRLGDGVREHGEDCKVNPKTVQERCDTIKGLDCLAQTELCACAPGYTSTGNTEPGSALCKPGEKVYDESCDPPEFLVRPRPIDPITGVPLPGPTSPPPPRFACNISKNLECFRGKCTCRDQAVSERYRLKPAVGACLVTTGYSCAANEDCFSNRCITKTEAAKEAGEKPASHDHGEKICAEPPKRSGAKIFNDLLHFHVVALLLCTKIPIFIE